MMPQPRSVQTSWTGGDELRIILDSVSDGVTVQDTSGRIVYANRAAGLAWGYETADELLGMSIREIAARLDLRSDDGVSLPLERLPAVRALAGESPPEFVVRVRDPVAAGERYWSVSSTPVRDPEGRVRLAITVFRDVTARTQRQRQLAEEERRLAVERERVVEAERIARKAMERASERAGRLHAVTAALSGALAPDEVAAVVVGQGIAALGAQAGSIALLTEAGDALEVLGTVGYPPDIAEAFRHIPLDVPFPLSDAVRGEAPIWLRSYEERDARYPHLASVRRANGTGAMAAIPLTVEGRAIGAMGLNFGDANPFDEEDCSFILTLADQCAQALERARLFEAQRAARAEAERMERRLAFLSEAGAVLIASLDYEATLRSVANLAVPRIADWCVVYVAEKPGSLRRLEIAAADPARLELLREAQRRFPIDLSLPNDIIARVVRTGEATLAPRLTKAKIQAMVSEPAHAVLLGELAGASLMVVPLTGRTRRFGAILLGIEPPRPSYEAEDLTLATELARRAAIAVDHALLYHEAQLTRAEAEFANRAKSDFLATMSHELRTPLNAIGGYAELLTMELRGPITEAQREDLRRIDRNQRHLLGVINDVLNFARLEAGQLELAVEAVQLHEVLAGIEALIAPQMRAKDLVYSYRPGDPAMVVHTDRERLEQVVLNLLSNAAKFTDRGGSVALEWGYDDREVVIRVRDTGCGIPADKLPTVFNPFVQLDHRYTRTTEGTGLGLAISRDLSRALGGELTAESTPGVGSVFTLTLRRNGPGA